MAGLAPAMMPTNIGFPVRLLHRQQFDVEHQCRIRRNDAAGPTRAVAERGRNDQRALAADIHRGDTLVPARDHLTLADLELERLVAVDGRIEFLALLAVLVEPSRVVHHAGLAWFGRRAGADLAVDDLQ